MATSNRNNSYTQRQQQQQQRATATAAAPPPQPPPTITTTTTTTTTTRRRRRTTTLMLRTVLIPKPSYDDAIEDILDSAAPRHTLISAPYYSDCFMLNTLRSTQYAIYSFVCKQLTIYLPKCIYTHINN